jgi:hypothetical protein
MKDLGKYWKPTKTDQMVTKPVKKKKSKVKKKKKHPTYNEEWRNHWKTI